MVDVTRHNHALALPKFSARWGRRFAALMMRWLRPATDTMVIVRKAVKLGFACGSFTKQLFRPGEKCSV